MHDSFEFENIDLADVDFKKELIESIPAQVARRYRVLPVFEESTGSLGIALAEVDAVDLEVLDNVAFALQRELVLRIADSQQLSVFIDRLYGGSV